MLSTTKPDCKYYFIQPTVASTIKTIAQLTNMNSSETRQLGAVKCETEATASSHTNPKVCETSTKHQQEGGARPCLTQTSGFRPLCQSYTPNPKS
jgi:hypothetical protein